MPNNLTILEQKLFETDFFLDKLKECKKPTGNYQHAQYYFSAFLSSSRSITFVMQSAFSKLPGFDNWYKNAQEILKGNDEARFFVDARNYSIKRGSTYFNIMRFHNNETTFYYHDDGEHKSPPKDDMVYASEEYLKFLLDVVRDFFIQFGEHVNPKLYYTMEKLKERGQSVKELELEVWGYNKWSSFNLSDEQILDYITSRMYITNIDKLFDKYLDNSTKKT